MDDIVDLGIVLLILVVAFCAIEILLTDSDRDSIESKIKTMFNDSLPEKKSRGSKRGTN